MPPPTIAGGSEERSSGTRISKVLFFAYVVLVIYGSLFPFHPWIYPAKGLRGLTHLPSYISRTDLLANVLVYFPVGLLFVWTRQQRRSASFLISTAIWVGACLSLTMESMQAFLPRDPALIDLLANVAGTTAGAVAGAFITVRPKPANVFLRLKEEIFGQGVATDLGLIALCVWIATQAFPFVPSLDVSSVRQSFSPAWQVIVRHTRFDLLDYAAYTTAVACLLLLAAFIGTDCLRSLRVTALIVGITIALKPFIVSRVLSLETLAGLASGIGIAYFLATSRMICCAAGFLVIANVIVLEMTPDYGATHQFNWIPFYGEGVNPLTGFLAILELMWQPVAFCSLLISSKLVAENRRAMWIGTIGAGSAGLLLEWAQKWIPGRYPEITPALLWAGIWLLCWGWAISRKDQCRKD